MAKKDSGFSIRKVLTEVGGAILGDGVRAVADEIKDKVHETIQTAQQKIEETIHRALKVLMLYIIVFIGLIFILVGLAQYLNEVVPALAHGMGFLVVGLVLILMGWFASWSASTK